MVRDRFIFGEDGWFERVGDMGVWAGGYVGGCVVLVGMGLGVAVDWFLVAGGFLLAVSVYLVHRVSWRDGGDSRTLTPALSLPPVGRGGRFLFLWRYVGFMRGLAVGAAVGAGVCLGMVSWWLVGLAVGAEVGILVYGVWQVGGKRVKDRLVVKNLAVAGAMVGFSVMVLVPDIEWGVEGGLIWRFLGVGVFLLGQVFGDAMLCDLDDVEWDRGYGSRTIPVVFGERATWMMALGLKVVLMVGGLWLWGFGGGDFRGLAVVGGGMVLGVLGLWIMRPRKVRDWVDLILPGVVGLGWFLG